MLVCAVALSGPALAGPIVGDSDIANFQTDRLRPSVYPAAYNALSAAPAEDYDPFFDLSWTASLRGAYQHDKLGDRFDVILAPSLSLDHTGTRSSIKFDASTEIRQPINGELNVSALRLGLGTTYALDSVTSLTTASNLSYNLPALGTPGQASDTAIPSTTITGGVDLGVTRQFGKFNVGLSGGFDRTVYGATTKTDATVVQNGDQNVWALNSGLRVGFQATPIFEIFGQAGLGRDYFDLPSSVLLVSSDATTVTAQAGIKGKWSSVLSAEVSTGVSLRRFDAASLDEVLSNLYNASITYTPTESLKLTAALTTTLAPPGPSSSGTTRVQYAATGNVNYTVNSWLALRALANWQTTKLEASTASETGYGFGVGADYKLNAHTALSADYNFAKVDNSTTGTDESHRVTLGVTLSR